MSEAKFTKGPWSVRSHDGSLGTIDAFHVPVAQAQEVSVADRNAGHRERIANARLIAAAPTMHALLEQLAENIERLDHGCYSLDSREGFDAQLFIDQVRGVLKATGEQA